MKNRSDAPLMIKVVLMLVLAFGVTLVIWSLLLRIGAAEQPAAAATELAVQKGGATSGQEQLYGKLAASLRINVGKPVFYQLKDAEILSEYSGLWPPLRKAPAKIIALRSDRTADLFVEYGEGFMVYRVRQDSGRSPGTWDILQPGDLTEPAYADK